MPRRESLEPIPPLPPMPKGRWRNGLWVEDPESIMRRAVAEYSGPTLAVRSTITAARFISTAAELLAPLGALLVLAALGVAWFVLVVHAYDEANPSVEERLEQFQESGSMAGYVTELSELVGQVQSPVVTARPEPVNAPPS